MSEHKTRGKTQRTVTNFNTFSKPQGTTSLRQPHQVRRACGVLKFSFPRVLWPPADTTPGQRRWSGERCTHNERKAR